MKNAFLSPVSVIFRKLHLTTLPRAIRLSKIVFYKFLNNNLSRKHKLFLKSSKFRSIQTFKVHNVVNFKVGQEFIWSDNVNVQKSAIYSNPFFIMFKQVAGNHDDIII